MCSGRTDNEWSTRYVVINITLIQVEFAFLCSMQTPWYNRWENILPMALLLGLAPFVPEPHILGKIRWIAGGAKGMGLLDWFDFFWHGWPWILVIRLGYLQYIAKKLPAETSPVKKA